MEDKETTETPSTISTTTAISVPPKKEGFFLEILRFTVPAGRLQEVAYLGRTYLPDEAAARGLVDEVVAPEALLARAIESANQLAAAPGPAFFLTKRQLRGPSRDFLEAHAAAIDAEVFAAWKSAEAQAAIRAYVEKTLKRR